MKEPDTLSPVGVAAFEEILDQALDSAELSDAIGCAVTGPTRGRLRAEALKARGLIAGAAAVEYDRYLRLWASAVEAEHGRRRDDDSTAAAREDGGGLLATLAVLVPSLGAVAAGVFLLTGFSLHALDARPHLGDGLIAVGVVAAAVAAGATLGDLAWLLTTAARNRAPADHSEPPDGNTTVSQAQEAWRLALLERGLLPFLLARLDAAGPPQAGSADQQG
ncbi:hypothetical protein AB0N07_48180 [Streptomyces sp. NPDC051172]|uniref:hypothetical protein n=1 Tax=Streptomyces sp. NPDC051172 TaxID=3155796 RepID=UPI0034218A9F